MSEQKGITKSSPASIELAKRQYISIIGEMIVNGRKMSEDQIVGRAAFAAQQGLDPISEVNTLIDKDGKTMSHSMHVNGLRRKNQEALGATETIDLEFVELPKEKMQADWAYAYECRLRDSVTYRVWQKRVLDTGKVLKEILPSLDYKTIIEACGPAPITVGVGTVYKNELSDWKDKNFNPIERCKKRAEVNARHHRFSTNAQVADMDTGIEVAVEGEYTSEPEPATQTVNVQLDGVESREYYRSQDMTDMGFEPPAERVMEPSIIGPETKPEPMTWPDRRERDWKSQKVSFETAAKVKDGNGVVYMKVDTEKVKYVRDSLVTSLAKENIPISVKEDKKFRIDVLSAILEADGVA